MQVLNVQKINKYLLNIKKGSGDSLTKLFKYTSSNLYCVASMYLINKNDVQDVLSRAYENVVKYIDSFDGKKNGYNWLFTIVRNCANEFNERESKRREVAVCDIDDNIDLEQEALDYILVREAIDRLDEDERELIYKIYWEGWTVTEIAQESNTPKTTIYSRLGSIYKKIKNSM